jgi:hypothetical protein
MTPTELTDISHHFATKADVADLRTEIKSDFINLQWRISSLIFGALVVNAGVVLGGMFGLAKLLGH